MEHYRQRALQGAVLRDWKAYKARCLQTRADGLARAEQRYKTAALARSGGGEGGDHRHHSQARTQARPWVC